MAKRDRFTKTKSIYTLRKRHMKTNDGTIYENDYTTLLKDDGIYNDSMALFSDSNFKFRVRTGNNEKRKHNRGNWIGPSENSANQVWTLTNVSGVTSSDESKIVLKPNYSSLKDFAYYGSAEELVKASINNIIKNFPAGISYYDDKDICPQFTIGDTTYYYVANGFNIDCWTIGYVEESSVDNPLRILAAGYKYFLDKNGNELKAPPTVEIWGNCLNGIVGQTTLYKGCTLGIYLNGDNTYRLVTDDADATGVIIYPKQEAIDEYWDTLDDFEKVILNKDSKPAYKAVFETPYQTEDGYFYTEKEYIWPTVNDDNFTPDVETAFFEGYLADLLSLAEYHDGIDSDNIWRMQTHEAIKNLDWTYSSISDGTRNEESKLDSSRVQAMLRLEGRQYDDIKRYADNIKSTNKTSYDEKNNIPDYFLSDNIENDGWIAKNTAPVSISGIQTDILFSGSTNKGYNSSDCNINFMRRLGISSDYIQSLKGTRNGIQTILGLFGYKDITDELKTPNTAGEYSIEEYIAVANKFPEYTEAARLRLLGDGSQYLTNDIAFEDYPVSVVTTSADTQYLIPWYDKETDYRDDIYFQSKGGWGKKYSKEINLSITSAKTITQGKEVRIYEETIPYMRYAQDIDDMLSISNDQVFTDMVCYVTDISDIESIYSASTTDSETINSYSEEEVPYSHYFILKNTSLSTYAGFVESDYYSCYGWRNVLREEFEGEHPTTEDGLRVIYLESLASDFKGNNPHTGKGLYDDGSSYIEYFNMLLGNMLDEGYFEYLKNSSSSADTADYNAISGIQFEVKSLIADNKKCHYFEDSSLGWFQSDDIEGLEPMQYSNGKDIYVKIIKGKITYAVFSGSNLYVCDSEGNIDKTKPGALAPSEILKYRHVYNMRKSIAITTKRMYNKDGSFYEVNIPADNDIEASNWDVTKLPVINPENGKKYEEEASYSVMNIKNIKINFGTSNNKYLKSYIENVVLKYLEEMIPATAILSYTFDGGETEISKKDIVDEDPSVLPIGS